MRREQNPAAAVRASSVTPDSAQGVAPRGEEENVAWEDAELCSPVQGWMCRASEGTRPEGS